VERDYAALVTPLLEGAHEHARYTRCWLRVRRLWRRLRRQPVGAHPRREALPELLQALLSAWGGAAAVSAAVFTDADALEGAGLQVLETAELSRRVAALAQSTWVGVAAAASPVAATALARRAARLSAAGGGTRAGGDGCGVGGGDGGGGGDGEGGGGDGGTGRDWVRRAAFTEILAEVPCPPEGEGSAEGDGRWLWDCFSPSSLEELILTGLLFGYALPSTAGVVLARLSTRRLRVDPLVLARALAPRRAAPRRSRGGEEVEAGGAVWVPRRRDSRRGGASGATALEASVCEGGQGSEQEAARLLEVAQRRLLARLPRGAPLDATLWARMQPGVAWPAAALAAAADEHGAARWVVEELRPRRRRPWVLVLARAKLRCQDDDMGDDDLAVS